MQPLSLHHVNATPPDQPRPRHVRPPRWHVVWPLAVMAMIFFASGQDKVADPGIIPHLDKLSHFSVFGLLATLVLRMFFDEGRAGRTALIAALGVSLYGIADEYRQSFTPGRSVEVADWIADTLGAILAVSAYGFWEGWRRFLERPVRRARTAAASSSDIAPEAPPVDASSAR